MRNIKIAIVSSKYRSEITDALDKHCTDTLIQKGVKKEYVHLYKVPGALEIPLICRKLAQKKAYDAIICFGAIFKGKTYHFEQVANECVRGCMNVSWEFSIPVIFEVLSVYNPKDAIERATGKEDNRGVEGAITALEMIEIIKSIS